MKNKNIHLKILELTVEELEPLKEDLAFLGGSTISLFLTEPQFIKLRETLDVDCVVEVTHRLEYEKIAQKLRKIGFNEDSQSPVLGRYRKKNLILDVMPTDEKIFGFSNIWYKEGFKNTVKRQVGKNIINVFDLPYIIATKVEAFKGRGKKQYMMSHDIEDIVSLFDGCSKIDENLDRHSKEISQYLVKELTAMISNVDFVNSLEAHISDRFNMMDRKKIILERIARFIKALK